jgi:hypothetical protein
MLKNVPPSLGTSLKQKGKWGILRSTRVSVAFLRRERGFLVSNSGIAIIEAKELSERDCTAVVGAHARRGKRAERACVWRVRAWLSLQKSGLAQEVHVRWDGEADS